MSVIIRFGATHQCATEALFRHLREAVPKAYSIKIFAIDPTDVTNRRTFEKTTELNNLISTGFVKAQRTLDVGKRGETDVIGKLLNKLFKTANAVTASTYDQQIADGLKASVADLEKAMQEDFDDRLRALLPALNTFGFPSLNDTELRPQTTIDVESLLTDNTRILYTGADGVHLPEGYNGLGTRNLIHILLQLEALHKTYRSTPMRPGTHIVFIEEPEAHLHPQMQEVFIGQLNEAVSTLSQKYPGETVWQVQFVVSTHSSHLANAAPFEAIRYFLNEATPTNGVRRTKVKDFRKGANKIGPKDRRFLQQYMTLTNCDLYFADKAILVEGATKRILMPRITKIVDVDLEPEHRLGRQYVTTIEAGGAHAQVFYPLLEYLELKTLIIVDLDAVKLVDSRWKKCPCAEGARTSNSAFKTWFDDNEISVAALQAKTPEEKTKGYCRIAYQMAEDGSEHCARSYEDALILANLADFGIADDANAAINAWETAQDFKKSEEAIKYAIREEIWKISQAPSSAQGCGLQGARCPRRVHRRLYPACDPTQREGCAVRKCPRHPERGLAPLQLAQIFGLPPHRQGDGEGSGGFPSREKSLLRCRLPAREKTGGTGNSDVERQRASGRGKAVRRRQCASARGSLTA